MKMKITLSFVALMLWNFRVKIAKSLGELLMSGIYPPKKMLPGMLSHDLLLIAAGGVLSITALCFLVYTVWLLKRQGARWLNWLIMASISGSIVFAWIRAGRKMHLQSIELLPNTAERSYGISPAYLLNPVEWWMMVHFAIWFGFLAAQMVQARTQTRAAHLEPPIAAS